MKCRWCRQEIEETALRCHHCRTWQREGADREEVREAQILDKGIIYWGKFISAVLAAFVVIAIAAGGYDIYHAHQEAWEAQRAARESQDAAERSSRDASRLLDDSTAALNDAKARAADAERSSRDASNLLNDAKTRVADADKLLTDGRAMLANLESEVQAHGAQIDQQHERLEEQARAIQDQYTALSGQARDIVEDDELWSGDSLKNQGKLISVLQSQVARLQDRLAGVSIGEPSPQTKVEPLSAEELTELNRILAIEQTSSMVPEARSRSGRQGYDVTLRACAFVNGECDNRRLDQVVRVIYRFDPQWFSVANVPVSSSANNFSYGLRVWGSTKVQACIFVRGAPGEPIAREGRMDLSGRPTYWGPDHPADPDVCEGLSGF